MVNTAYGSGTNILDAIDREEPQFDLPYSIPQCCPMDLHNSIAKKDAASPPNPNKPYATKVTRPESRVLQISRPRRL